MEKVVNVNFRLGRDIKDRMEEICYELGLSMSTAFTIFAKAVVRQQRIPFAVALDTPNDLTKEVLAEYRDMKENKESYKRYSSFSEILQEVAEESVEYNKVKAV